jgi:SAM-dependent methyltransferase
VDLDSDLTQYYDAEARGGLRGELDTARVEIRRRYVDALRKEQRSTVIDVGAGPGRDTVAFHQDGFDVTGVDLAPANVAALCSQGPDGVTASLYALPFRTSSFEALWTMSTFVHVPHHRFDDAMVELLRVVVPGAPMAIGTWGGRDYEGVPEFGELRPYRFFSLASHERWRSMLERHGDVEQFVTSAPTRPSGWEYQFAVVRCGG